MNEEYTNPYFDPRWGSQTIAGYGDSSTYLDQPQSGGTNYGQIAGGASAGLGAGMATNPDRFNMSGGGIMGAAGSGAASGFASGGPIGAAVGAVVGGVTSFFKQDKQMRDNIENVNTSFNGMTDVYGRPVYQGGEFAQGLSDLDEMREAGRPGAKAMRQRRRKQLLQKTGELYQGIQQGQQNYNAASDSYRNRGIQMQEYFERLNNNRLQNLHTY